MSNKKSAKRQIPAAAEAARASSAQPGGNSVSEFFASKAVRETIESVAIAFVLAFLFRTFEAEAFVIPTGSMAQTLMGAHKEVVCAQCGYQHTAGASEGNVQREGAIIGTTCPMCRYINRFAPDDPNYRTYTGDRILVSKFIYDFQEPQRWDVVVFKCPNNEKNNYIKRLVGLPSQTTSIRRGDIWYKNRDADESEYVIARKPPQKIRAMLQEVHDTHYIPAVLDRQPPWARRWDSADGGWQQEFTALRRGQNEVSIPTFTTSGGAHGRPAWLRYRHYLPTAAEWDELLAGRATAAPAAQLITDFYSYNAAIADRTYNPRGASARQEPWQQAGYGSPEALGLHWVGDLAVECDVEIKSVAGTLLLDLVEAGVHYQCAVDVASGQAILTIAGRDGTPGHFSRDDGADARQQVTGQTPIRGPGRHRLMLANVDDQLTLWVDGRTIAFDGPTTYIYRGDYLPAWTDDDEGDLAPAGVGSVGAALAVERLKIYRDIYYIAAKSDYGSFASLDGSGVNVEAMAAYLSNPRRYAAELKHALGLRESVKFDLGADQFFTLGDNSPQSLDARIWGKDHYVTREFLIGKALFIYWPHAVGPVYLPNPFSRQRLDWVPITPNFKEMGFVR